MLLIVRKFPLFFVFLLPVSVSKRSELSDIEVRCGVYHYTARCPNDTFSYTRPKDRLVLISR